MVKNTYAQLGKLTHRLAIPFLRLYPPRKLRVRVLVVNNADEVLLTRSWFGYQRWSLPGGGIRRREAMRHAAVREVYEETGIRLRQDQLRSLGEFQNHDSAAPFAVGCFAARIKHQSAHIATRYRLEMLDVAWFPLKHLPRHCSQVVTEALRRNTDR